MNPLLDIDWELVTKLFPLWAVRNGKDIIFNNDNVGTVVPQTVRGVLLKPTLGEDEVLFIGSQVNSIAQSVIPNTIYDDLTHVTDVINLFKGHLGGEGAGSKQKFSVSGAYDHYTTVRGRPPVIHIRTFQKLASLLPTFEPLFPLLLELCSTSFGGRGITKVN